MINKATLLGRLTKDPEVKDTGRVKFASLSVATNESYKSKETGEYVEKSEFHNITVFGDGLVGYIQKALNKGDVVYIEGRIETRSYESDGVKKYAISIVVNGQSGKLVKVKHPVSGERDKKPPSDDFIPF